MNVFTFAICWCAGVWLCIAIQDQTLGSWCAAITLNANVLMYAWFDLRKPNKDA